MLSKSYIDAVNVKYRSFQPECFPDRAIQRMVQQLTVTCKYSDHACPWTGPIEDYQVCVYSVYTLSCELNKYPLHYLYIYI